jgi:hypothetical protein
MHVTSRYAVTIFACASIGAALAQTPPLPSNARVKVTPQLSLQSMRNLPDTAEIETRRGTVVSTRRFVEVADAIRGAHSRPRTPSPSGFSRTAAAPSVVVRPGTHMPSLLARPDSDVVRLPNGTRLTVGDMKKLAQIAPQLRGRPLVADTRADLRGNAVRISSARELANLRTAPDSTVLENPNGVRITLGELRAEARKQRR